jgi:hypothetical protein
MPQAYPTIKQNKHTTGKTINAVTKGTKTTIRPSLNKGESTNNNRM